MVNYVSPLITDMAEVELEPLLQSYPMQTWRWKAEHSNGWEQVRGEEHAKMLIRCVDEDWPWLILEKGTEDELTFVQLLGSPTGMVIEVNSPHEWVSRVSKNKKPKHKEIIGAEGHNLIALDNEVFSVNEAIPICIQWMKSRTLNSSFSLQDVEL